MSELDTLGIAARGMDAERIALEAAARNVAASEADGGAFTRLVPEFSGDGDDEFDPAGDGPLRFLGMREVPGGADTILEMVSVLDAQRAFEADATVFDAGKRFAERAIDLGRS
jgi:flagellar basal body rod protein FlgC